MILPWIPDEALPIIFAGLMGLSLLLYGLLDGLDLGVGVLMRRANQQHRDLMIASIGPFWDANETWLVLGIGLLLVAFPVAHGMILGALYIPVAILLLGLILRGVAFDFRVKAQDNRRPLWNALFYLGSLMACLAQGYMLGNYLMGFASDWVSLIFSAFIALCFVAGYALLGSCWLIMKTENELRIRAVRWARGSLWLTAAGIAAISIATPLVSERMAERWFSLPNLFFLLPVPIITTAIIMGLDRVLTGMLNTSEERLNWVPFAGTVALFMLASGGIAYSLFPYVLIDQMTFAEAAAAPESLRVILLGALIVLPIILLYTAYSYRVFWGKTRLLTYE
ncbi:MAG: cytochrome BD ubiquinol oxidase subunit II [Acinetobacter sp.]|nr:cytochrome BD ubiquinol oxidase subunit II [Acinetobacter sp.]